MTKKFMLFTLLLLAATGLYAQKSWVAFTSDQPAQSVITIQQSDRAGMTLEITVPGMYRQQIAEEDMVFDQLSLTAGATTQEVGLPELPMLSQVIGIPGNQKVSFKIIEKRTKTVEGYNVYPFQTPTTDNPGGHDHPFVMDQNFYNQNRTFPAVNVQMDAAQIWRDVKLTNLHVTPFSYNPSTQTLEVITHLVVAVGFEGNDNAMQFNPRMELSPKFYNMYQSAIPNFETLGYTMGLRETPGIKYLVITNEEALDAIQPLVDWKNQMGHRTEVRTLEAGFNTPQEFKTYITELYETDGLEYVLMVGDAYPNGGTGGGPNIVPMYWWAPGGDPSYSDSWYTCLDGPSDHFADLAIGRFVYDANSLDELEMQIGKTMTHYLTPDMSDNWGENTILVANKEQYPEKYTQCCNEIAAFNYSIQTPIFEKAYGGEGYTNSQVVEFVNSTGVGIFNYRGHGSATQLWDWTNAGPSHFTAADVSQLNNVNKLFVFFDVCCDNMDIVAHANDCLCESFMKHESGSVAVNGAIIPSYTIPNHDYDKEMYKALFEENITNIGYITNYANLTVLNVHGEIGKSNVRTYLWLGDASIEPWTKQPTNLTVSHDQQLFLGMSEFTVTVSGNNGSAEGAMVCVSNEDQSIYAVAYADGSGMATIDFGAPVQDPGTVMVTVTGHNYMPYQSEVPVIPQEGPYVVKDSFVINDNAGGNGNGMMDYTESILLSLSVKNVGIEVAQNVVVTISTQDEYVTITDSEENYGDVDPDGVVTVEDGFALEVAENIPDGHAVIFDVMASDGTDGWNSTLVINGHAPALAFNGYSVNDASGNNNGFLDPGETVEFTVNIINAGSADAYTVAAALTSSDPLLTVITTEPQEIGDLTPDANGNAIFTVTAAPEIVPGYFGELNLLFTADFNISQEDVIPISFSDYCDASTSNQDEYISNVSLGEINNSSGWQGGVADYKDITTTLEPGVAEAIVVTNGNAWSSDKVTVWIDWNMDKELGNNTNETFVLTSNNGGQTFTGNITPPVNQQGGQYRMRVRMTYSSAPAPCDNSSYGEVEDYTVIIAAPMAANFNANEVELCEDNEVNFTDNSSGNVLSWSWEFEGGTPATSAEENPTVMYAEGGIFDVTLTVTGTQGSHSITKTDYILVADKPDEAGDVIGSTQTCQGYEETFSIDLIEYADTYNWVLTPAEAGEVTVTDNSISILMSLDYEGDATLKVCGGNDCGEGEWSDEFVFTINTCVGIFDGQSSVQATIYPNPGEGVFTLELTGNDVVQLQVISAIGEVIYKKSDVNVDGHLTTDINLNGFAEGVYFLKIDGNTLHEFQKIVITR
ncbi:MAG: T9SS type A sorting domain-containing protein [Bacteroidales bacterium]|nr:T9SS type A sorting domain-containing protein [Bacteroidales bacterium]